MLNKNGKPICGARRHQCSKCKHQFSKDEYELTACPDCGFDRFCKNRVEVEGWRCRFHGGRALVGTLNPNFKDGSRSKYVPKKLISTYEDALADEDLMNLRMDVGLLETRLRNLMGRLDEFDGVGVFPKLRACLDRMHASPNPDVRVAAFEEMERLINMGMAEEVAWAEIRDILEQRRRAIESERKRMVEMHQMITVEQMFIMISAISASVKKHVQDNSALIAISADIKKLMAARA